MTIGENIKEYRKARGFTQHELGELIGVEQYIISQYENSANLPRIEVIEKLARALNIAVTDLLPKYHNTTITYENTQTLKEIIKAPPVRISKDKYYLKIAEVVAIRSTCIRRKYGAVIVNNDEIIATGYNGSPRGETNCCDTGKCYRVENSIPIDTRAALHGDQYGSCVAVHAEQNAIISASRKELQGATLYLVCLSEEVNPSPCNICNRMLKNAGISKVVTKEDIL